MLKSRFFIFNFALLGLIFLLNSWALSEFLYWRIWWFDILMHILGGFFVGSSALWFYFEVSPLSEGSRFGGLSAFTVALVSVLIIGIGWEVYEFLADRILQISFDLEEFSIMQPGVIDTIGDMLSDILGGMGAVITFEKIWKKVV